MRILELLPEYIEYLLHERQLMRSTMKAYEGDLEVLAAFADKPVSDISRDDLRSFIRNMSKAGLATSTIRRRIHGYRTFWDWLKLTQGIEDNVADLVHLPKLTRKVPNWLSEDELSLWVQTPAQGPTSALRLRNRTTWLTMAWLGLRRSEILNLVIEDVRCDDREMIIKNAKGRKDRVLPIPVQLHTQLSLHVADRPKSHYVFSSRYGNKWHHAFFHRAFKVHVQACGLVDRGVTPHTLRHTFATHLIRQGVDVTMVSKLMGHKDIKTTMIYIHHDPLVMKSAMDRHILNRIDALN